jgi:hypothetical protein
LPSILKLKEKQWKSLADALLRLLESLNMTIIDLPDSYQEDAIYNLFLMHWDYPLQYLPLAGYDIEFCTREPDTCPYGVDCNYCYGEFTDDEEFNDEELDEDEESDDNDDFPKSEPGFIGGFFNDDGSRIDPLKVPIPELCLRCKSYLSDDWEDNILCTLNRNDQRDSEEFECGAYR